MNHIRTIAVLFLFCFCLAIFALSPEAHAGEAADQVKQTVDAVITVLNDKEFDKPGKKEQRKSALRDIIVKRFDFEEMAKRSLGVYWSKRTKEEQKEFVALYSDLLENTYIRKIERYEDQKVEYTGEKEDGSYAVVRTRITGKGTAVPVDYKIFKKEGKWSVYDIVIEGVSLVNNYRSQFGQILGKQPYEELVKRLRNKALQGS